MAKPGPQGVARSAPGGASCSLPRRQRPRSPEPRASAASAAPWSARRQSGGPEDKGLRWKERTKRASGIAGGRSPPHSTLSAIGLTLTFSGEVHGGRPEGTACGASSVCNGMLGQGPTLCEGPPLVSALGARTQTGRDHARFAPFARSDPGRTCSNKLRHGYGRARRRRAAPSRQVSPVACP